MSPNTRQRKSTLSRKITKSIQEYGLSIPEQVEVMTLSLKQLGIYEKIKFERKPTKKGRNITPFETRKKVWEFWHENSTESTNTTSLAKLRQTDKSHIQANLDFVSTVSIIRQRNRLFYQSICKTVQVTYKELYIKFLNNHDEQHHISWGTFLALKPFYVKPNTLKEIEMCCCKLHLHARWSISAFVQCCENQNISLQFSDYGSFFECPNNDLTYISWDCFLDNKTLFNNITRKWQNLILLASNANENVTVPMMMFEKHLHINKNGSQTERLKALKKDINLQFLTDFIGKILYKIIHHRNMLKNYRNTGNSFKEYMNAAYLDIDFAENLTVPVKFEPQSLHWAKEQVTVHSGILKTNGQKSYHPYFSDMTMTKCLSKSQLMK